MTVNHTQRILKVTKYLAFKLEDSTLKNKLALTLVIMRTNGLASLNIRYKMLHVLSVGIIH